jgi:hypothetical protein
VDVCVHRVIMVLDDVLLRASCFLQDVKFLCWSNLVLDEKA